MLNEALHDLKKFEHIYITFFIAQDNDPFLENLRFKSFVRAL